MALTITSSKLIFDTELELKDVVKPFFFIV